MNTFHSNIINIYGAKGQNLLDELTQIVAIISSSLGLRDLKEVTNLTYNYVLSGLLKELLNIDRDDAMISLLDTFLLFTQKRF